MQHGGATWETTVDELNVRRWTAPTGGMTLVRLRLANDGDDPLAVRIVEQLPDAATDAVPITVAGDEADTWRFDGDWIVHEFGVPASGTRTNAYLLKSDEEPPISLVSPDVETVEPVDDAEEDAIPTLEERPDPVDGWAPLKSDATSENDEQPTTETVDHPVEDDQAAAGVVTTEAGAVDEGTTDENVSVKIENAWVASKAAAEADDGSSRPSEDASVTGYRLPRTAPERPPTETSESIVSDLLDALEEEASPAERRALRSKLGASDSERARLGHVQSRLDDLAAYIDALEGLVDRHGMDVVDDLRDAVDENASATETLRSDLDAIEGHLERLQAETDESIASLESEMTEMRSGFDERLGALESSIETIRTDVESLTDDVENDRQARAREVRRFDKSLTDVEEAIEHLDERIGEFDAFRRQFTNALSSIDPSRDDADSSGPVECDPS